MKGKLTLTIEEAAEIFHKIQSNLQPLFYGNGVIGSGLFLSINTSTIKHSCVANAKKISNGKELSLMALGKIESFADVRFAYCPYFSREKEFRRKYLRERFFFECQCWLCNNEELEEMYSSMICNQCKVGCVPISKMTCLDCGYKANPNDARKYHEFKARIVMPSFQNYSPTGNFKPEPVFENLETYEHIFKEAFEVLHPMDVTFFNLSRMAQYSVLGNFSDAMKSYVEIGSLPQPKIVTLKFAAQVQVQRLRTILPPLHTSIANMEFDYAMCLAHLGEIEKADAAFARSESIFQICPGVGYEMENTFRKVALEHAKAKIDMMDSICEKARQMKMSGELDELNKLHSKHL